MRVIVVFDNYTKQCEGVFSSYDSLVDTFNKRYRKIYNNPDIDVLLTHGTNPLDESFTIKYWNDEFACIYCNLDERNKVNIPYWVSVEC
ncbi:MAG: hypothetical protein ACOCV1_07970 [Bacillota bacterium]